MADEHDNPEETEEDMDEVRNWPGAAPPEKLAQEWIEREGGQ